MIVGFILVYAMLTGNLDRAYRMARWVGRWYGVERAADGPVEAKVIPIRHKRDAQAQ